MLPENRIKSYRILFIFLFITLFLFNFLCFYTSAFAQSAPKCEICGKNIYGKYWRVGGHTFCNDCYGRSPKCQSCGIPMKKYYKVDGKKFCLDCYYHRLPRCAKCGKPMYHFYTRKGRDGKTHKYCRKCMLKIVGNCPICGKVLLGKTCIIKSNLTGQEKEYCEKCVKKAKHCFHCGLLVSPHRPPLPDGRQICSSCRRKLIYSDNEYHGIYKQVRNQFRKLGLKVNHLPQLNIVDLNKLSKLNVSDSKSGDKVVGDKMGLYQCTKFYRNSKNGKQRMTGIRGRIYILNYLPRDIAYWVMSHEYAHAWYEERVMEQKGLIIVEGFAEWVAYHLLLRKGYKNIARGMTKRENVYGKGLRYMIDLQKKKGFRGVLRYVTR